MIYLNHEEIGWAERDQTTVAQPPVPAGRKGHCEPVAHACRTRIDTAEVAEADGIGCRSDRDVSPLPLIDDLVAAAQPVLLAHAVGKYGLNLDEAGDLLQSFWCERVIGGDALECYEPSRGQLHTFLRRSLDNFLVSEWRRARAQKRCPPDRLVPLDGVPDSELPQCEQADARESEVRWGQILVAGALLNMQRELTLRGRRELWAVFEARVLRPTLNDEPPMPYEELVERFGFRSPKRAFNTLISAKRIFRRHLRAVMAAYAGTDRETDEEIEHLRCVFAGI